MRAECAPVRSELLATRVLLNYSPGRGQGASAMEQVSGQSQQFVERSIAEVLRFVQLVWTWSSDQIIKVTQAPWEHWPLWKQMLLLIVAAAAVYFLFYAAMQRWTRALKAFAFLATLIGALSAPLPTTLR